MSNKPPKGKGSRAKLRDFFTENVGKIVNSDTLRNVAGTSEWARRVRELRNEEGMNIVTHNDRSGLKPGIFIKHLQSVAETNCWLRKLHTSVQIQ
jgi:hypothetical protein